MPSDRLCRECFEPIEDGFEDLCQHCEEGEQHFLEDEPLADELDGFSIWDETDL